MNQKKEISSATLAPSKSIIHLLIEQLVAGLIIVVEIEGKSYVGRVYRIEPSSGNDLVFADVVVPDPENEREELCRVRVSIHIDGQVLVMPGEPSD